MKNRPYYLGIDLGSVSLNTVVIDPDGQIQAAAYERTQGRPLAVLLACMEALACRFNAFQGIVVTGSGRKFIGRVLGVRDINEIVTQARGTCHLYPDIRTIVEIGGQDSKLIFVDRDHTTGEPVVVDHALNEVCAAGTGSFLDLQAHRLGIKVETIGDLAMKAKHPARISGRCSVFAKSDMVHLLQEGTPKPDIVAGLCNALALNFITNLGKGRPFPEPIVFQGGVAANGGVVKAFEKTLGLSPGSLIVPEHFLVMGALGSALMACNGNGGSARPVKQLIEEVRRVMDQDVTRDTASLRLTPLVPRNGASKAADRYYEPDKARGPVFLGIDVGAVSTNLVLIDQHGNLIAKQYWFTQGELADTVRKGLAEMGHKMGGHTQVCGVGVTGSGRYFIGDFVGADVVINEISAQARAAIHFDPHVETIIEIGGQDSKYIQCDHGQVVDFEMNKVCAAGTGSFLEEQAARLKLSIRDDFSRLAFSSVSPVNLGPRCTVFMESDLVHHQQTGKGIHDLAAGLAYAIASNYQEKVVGTKKIGMRVLFQGGVAGNQSVAAAFENLLNKPVTIPEHHHVTGAVGAALAARDRQPRPSRFAGFNLKDRPYEIKTFECQQCPNRCSVHKIYIGGKLTSYYGSLCGRYDKGVGQTSEPRLPDLLQERMDHLMQGISTTNGKSKASKGPIGIPMALGFFDFLPFWAAFFEALGYPVVFSQGTNKTLIQQGMAHVASETCFPVKSVYGHVVDLVSKGVEQILLPCEIDHPKDLRQEGGDATFRTFNCPYVQSIAYMVKSAMGSTVRLLKPIIRWSQPRHEINRVLQGFSRSLGHTGDDTSRALAAAWSALHRFETWRDQRGKEMLASLGANDRCLVLLGKTHNIFDPGLNLHLARKLKRLGQTVVPFDMLPLEDVVLPARYDNVVWKNTRDLLKALFWMRERPSFSPVLLTNFGCGPDSFFMKYMETELCGKPRLILEVDDHTGDAGMVTRIEAFLETVDHARDTRPPSATSFNLVIRGKTRTWDPWTPRPALMRRLQDKTLCVPFVSEAFSGVVQAAFENIGLEARVLPEPDENTEYLGRQVTSGRECHPYIVTCGAFVRLTREQGFDPDRCAIMMLNYDGACRFSQYAIGHADLFRRLGLSQVPIIAPLTSTRFDEFSGLFGLRFTKALWQGWLAAEVLDRIRLHTRPYEKVPGLTDSLYAEGIRNMVGAVARSNGRPSLWNRDILLALQKAAQALRAVPVDRSDPRPRVGCVGEFYTVLNSRANQDLIRTLEELGAEVTLHGLTVSNFFSLFSQHYYPRNSARDGRPVTALYYWLRNQWMMSWIRQVEACLPKALRPFGNLDARAVIQEAEPFIHYDIDPVLATLTARVRRFAAAGVSGICNLFVLNCMLGNVTVPIFKNALKGYDHLPILQAVYDGQEQTNMLTRVEAFMHQARLYHERNKGRRTGQVGLSGGL